MISYHPSKVDPERPGRYFAGFRSTHLTEPERLAKCMAGYVWSPCVWRWGKRKQSNFIGALWCVMDFDDGDMSLDQAVRTWQDMTHVIGTTKSHQQLKNGHVCDRFRVAIRWKDPITDLRRYRYNMVKFTNKYPCDTSCRDAARFFFPCKEIVSVGEGFAEDVTMEVPERFEKPDLEMYRAFAEAHITPLHIMHTLKNKPPPGKRNVTVYGLGKDLARLGKTLAECVAIIEQFQTVNLSEDDYYNTLISGHKAGQEEMNV